MACNVNPNTGTASFQAASSSGRIVPSGDSQDGATVALLPRGSPPAYSPPVGGPPVTRQPIGPPVSRQPLHFLGPTVTRQPTTQPPPYRDYIPPARLPTYVEANVTTNLPPSYTPTIDISNRRRSQRRCPNCVCCTEEDCDNRAPCFGHIFNFCEFW